MEKDVAMGPESQLKMSFVSGKARVEIAYAGKQANAGAFIEMDAKQYLDLLKDAIPGTIDDSIINVLEAAMTVVP